MRNQLPMTSSAQGMGYFGIKKSKHTLTNIKPNIDFFWNCKICSVSLCFNTMKPKAQKTIDFWKKKIAIYRKKFKKKKTYVNIDNIL